MQPSNVPRLRDLPDELLDIIVDQLDNESIFQLSMTCSKLHLLALPVVFTRANLPKYTTDFFLQQPTAHLLRALRMALFVHHVSSFVVVLDPDSERHLPVILNLNRLISRMSTIAMFAFYSPYSSLPLSNEGGAFDEERRRREVVRLFDGVLNKSCASFRVRGDIMPTLSTSTPGAQSTNTSPPSAALLRRPFLEKIGHRLRNLPKISKRTIPPTAPQNSAHPSGHRQLKSFHVLSSMLFQSHFLNWTTSTLHTSSRTLTEVSFKTDRVPPSTWHGLLSQVTLPSLSKLQVTCDSIVEPRTVDFDDMLDFLIRHPTIVDLDLYGLTVPTSSRRPWNLLPALETLTSYPQLIIELLDREYPLLRSLLTRYSKPREYPLVNLKSLNIVSEVYPEPPTFNYDTFENVLALVPRSTPSLTTLSFSFLSFPGVTEWFDKQISRGPLTALKGVTTLKVVSPLAQFWKGVVMDRIPRFLALFLGLRHFTYPLLPPNLDMDAVKGTFLRDIGRTCPRMMTVTFGQVGMVDLDSLREV